MCLTTLGALLATPVLAPGLARAPEAQKSVDCIDLSNFQQADATAAASRRVLAQDDAKAK